MPEPEVDAWELLSHVFSLSKKDYFLRMNEEAEDQGAQEYERLLERRCTRLPLQQILGHTGFMGLDFLVNAHVLCPRQDTELLVEKAGEYLFPGAEVLDLCTGSGCVLISLMRMNKDISGTGVDISEEAIAVARENAKRNFVHPLWRTGSLFQPVEGKMFDLVVSNPPYIPTGVIEGLMPEVRDHEPRSAIDGGEDGLAFYRRIVADAPSYLKEGGWLLFEVGVGEALPVESLLFDRGFCNLRHFKDYAGNDRVVRGQWCSWKGR